MHMRTSTPAASHPLVEVCPDEARDRLEQLRPFVWVLVPYAIDGTRLQGETYDSEAVKTELAATFHDVGCPWIMQFVVAGNVDLVAAQLAASAARRPTVAFNFCDGLDWDGTPGLSVVKALEAAGVPFTGSDSRFYEISTYKLRMKQRFLARGIETAPWEALPRSGPVRGVCDRLGTPLFVKPDASYASFGISLKSKAFSDADLERRRDELRDGGLGPTLAATEIFAERYLAGDEYTVFVGGSSASPATIWTLPPARRCFAPSIPPEERYLTYDRYWGYFQEETAPAAGEAFYHYELVESPLSEEIAALAVRAYQAVSGHGYARVDLRADGDSGRLSLLEVNANCGLSGDDQTSTGSILQLMGGTYADLVRRILLQALGHAA